MDVDNKEHSGCNGISARGAVGWGNGGFPESTHPLESIQIDINLGTSSNIKRQMISLC